MPSSLAGFLASRQGQRLGQLYGANANQLPFHCMSDIDETIPARLVRLEVKTENAEDWREKTDRTLAELVKTLQMLARIELQSDALAKQVLEFRAEHREANAALAQRVKDIETDMPSLKATNKAAHFLTGAVVDRIITIGASAAAAWAGIKFLG